VARDEPVSQAPTSQPALKETHLEGLGIPVLDLLDGRHVAEVMWQLIEFFHSMSQAYRQLLCCTVKNSIFSIVKTPAHPTRTGWLSAAFPG
jgi:hypothetical protein